MEERTNILQTMQICRFCLDDKGPFGNIYDKTVRFGKTNVALPLQVMACAAIEVYRNDGMPQFICNRCNSIFNEAYKFKKSCKRAEEALKSFLTTGNLIKPKASNATSLLLHPTSQKRSLPSSNMLKQFEIPVPQEPRPQKLAKLEETAAVPQEAMNEEPVGELSNEDSQDASMEEIEEVFIETDDSNTVDSPKVSQVETNVFPCEQCDRSFPLKQLLELHEKNHGRERNNPCELCDRKFFTKYDLAKHVQSHTMAKPFTCVVCNKTFAREPLLHRHEKTHVNVPKYVCPECDKHFLSREDFDAHVEKHKKKRPFICRLCDKRFVFKQGLERHEASHADEKPHKCNYCEASFTSPIKLMRHITSHAGLRPYPCKVCGRTFLLSHHLTRHLRTHYSSGSGGGEGVGQHKCDVCSMSFRRKDSLINHSAIHSMVNLKCVICNTAFNTAKEVKDHITTHLAGLPYPCDKCDYSFETQEQLEEHELKHAEMEYEEQIEQEVTKEAMEENQTILMTHGDGDDEDDSDLEGEITEYTITNDDENNPQVVPRKRKVLNSYATFLKEELDSDAEIVIEHSVDEDEAEAEEDEEGAEGIKPIVRSEGTKVYTRKASMKKLSSEKSSKSFDSTIITDAANISLDSLGLTQELVKDLPTEQYIDMKFGDVIYKVKKITLKKTEFEAVAKQGNVEMKDGLLVKKTIKSTAGLRPDSTKNITIENIIDEPKTAAPKQVVKKTYIRKSSLGAASHISKEEDEANLEMIE